MQKGDEKRFNFKIIRYDSRFRCWIDFKIDRWKNSANFFFMIICTNFKSLYDCLVRLGSTHEKRLMIDIMCLRESYERRKITKIKWIDGKSNSADAMIKFNSCAALKDFIDTNRINLQITDWVERESKKKRMKFFKLMKRWNFGDLRECLFHLKNEESDHTCRSCAIRHHF